MFSLTAFFLTYEIDRQISCSRCPSFFSNLCHINVFSSLPFELLCQPRFLLFLSIYLSVFSSSHNNSIFSSTCRSAVSRARNITNLRFHFRQIGHGVHAIQEFQHFQFGESSERGRHHSHFRRHLGSQIRSIFKFDSIICSDPELLTNIS